MGHWLSVRSALQLMQQHEATVGYRFDAVMLLRPDDAWLAPLPPWCTFERLFRRNGSVENPNAVYSELVGSTRADYVGGIDWWSLAGREMAESVYGLADIYLNCSGQLEIPSSEIWMMSTINSVINSHPTAEHVRLQNLPRVTCAQLKLQTSFAAG